MVIKVAVPHQFKLKVIPDLKTLFFVDRKDIHYIGGSDILPAPLEAAAEKKAIKDLGTEKDENARKILIEHNLRLVVYIAKKFDNTGVGVEDLISIGTIGLIKAINTFNPDKNIKLATYASRCIENEILMYLRRNNKTRMEVSIDEPLNVDWSDAVNAQETGYTVTATATSGNYTVKTGGTINGFISKSKILATIGNVYGTTESTIKSNVVKGNFYKLASSGREATGNSYPVLFRRFRI